MTDDESDSLNELTVQQACLLASTRAGQPIFLNSLQALSPDVARALKKSSGKCSTLCLNRLRDVSVELAEELVWCASHGLCLNGLEQLPDAVAAELARHDGRYLQLNSVKSISAEAAHHLAMAPLEITLTGLERQGVPYEAWEILDDASGHIDLPHTFPYWEY